MEQMTEYGQVVAVSDGEAHVKFSRTSACAGCGACGMLAHQNEIVVRVKNELNARAGDCVVVTIKTGKALRASALAYVFPLFMLLLGAFVGWLFSAQWHVLENTDASMALFAVVFAVISFFLLKVAAPLYNKSMRDTYRMVGIKPANKTKEV